jgi:phenylalanyl-tRNA synthetase beta chain
LLPSLLAPHGLEDPVFVAEISLPRLFARLAPGFIPRHTPLSRTPSVSRDLSLILDRLHTYAEVEETILGVEDAWISRVSLFDFYQGKPVPEGKVGMAVNIVFQAPGRTLVSGEVAQAMDRIVQRLRDRLGAVLRGN